MRQILLVHKALQRHLVPSSEYIYGFADLTGLLDQKYTGFTTGLSIGKKLNYNIVDEVIDGPTISYYSHYKQINKDLSSLCATISSDLECAGIRSIVVEPTVSTTDLDTIYSQTLRTDLSHKMVATRAGLGWIGKSDLLVTREFGPRLRLVTILLNIPPWPLKKPVTRSRCGKCTVCVDSCPAKAASGHLWEITTDRNEFFDPWKCRDKCAEFGRDRLGTNARVCGICVAVCPIGR